MTIFNKNKKKIKNIQYIMNLNKTMNMRIEIEMESIISPLASPRGMREHVRED